MTCTEGAPGHRLKDCKHGEHIIEMYRREHDPDDGFSAGNVMCRRERMHADDPKSLVVYLAGPINGCTDDEANNWRDVAKAALGVENTLDPMRRDYRGIEDQSVDEIVHGDLADIDASGVMLANCWQVSWGTGMEIHYAHTVGTASHRRAPGRRSGVTVAQVPRRGCPLAGRGVAAHRSANQ